jgi:tRNA dimethylallyltransferase
LIDLAPTSKFCISKMLSADPPSETSHAVKLPLVIILGPTAVGKTEISLKLAERLEAEIISADSRLFYRGMDIGTAKPSPVERERVPHHLIDILDPDESWSLAEFQLAVHELALDIHARGKLPFLVGGTGQYIRAICEGWLPPRQKPDPVMRAVLERWGHEIGPRELHSRLALLDPEAALQIDPNNLRRTVRALEVIFKSGELFSSQRRRRPVPYELLQLGLQLPRSEIFARIDTRLENMLADGWLEEVAHLLEVGYTMESPGMAAIGYRQLAQVQTGELSLEEALVLIKRQTRSFVRRQANWFKSNDPQIHWFLADHQAVNKMEALINQVFPAESTDM